jgi:hypothetical protein
MSADTTLSVVANDGYSTCEVRPCPYCVLGVPHNATMEEAADAYRIEYERFVDNESNPWRYWMRSVAWNQIYVNHRETTTPLEPGPWDEDTRGPDPLGGLTPCVPLTIFPNLIESWSSCCEARTPPPAPPQQFGSRASASTDGVGHGGEASDEKLLRWQYEGGKKRKWCDYLDGDMTLLEDAYQSGRSVVHVRIDDWDYMINITNMTQHSNQTGMVRGVRRLLIQD